MAHQRSASYAGERVDERVNVKEARQIKTDQEKPLPEPKVGTGQRRSTLAGIYFD